MKFTLNGLEHEVPDDSPLSLLHYLRDSAGITSVRDGCSPQGACGACAVQIEGRTALSCTTPVKRLAGKHVLTPDGLEPLLKRVFREAFVEHGGLQCGFCTPGVVMRAKTLLEHNPHPSREEIAGSLDLHLCRCTGYAKIIDAIEAAGEMLRGERPLGTPRQTGRVGTRLPKVNAREQVLGEKEYVDDLRFPGMVYGALRLSDHPRARVLSIDVSAAQALPGVVRVFLADDIPGTRHVGLLIPDWPVLVAVGETTRYVGDALASVAAETRAIAREAAALIKVEYEVLEPLLDPLEALRDDAPRLHASGNLLGRTDARKGDAAAAFATCDLVTEGTYHTQRIEHGFLEPECAVALPRGSGADRGVKVFSQGQGVYEDRRQIASLLGLPESAVEVELVPNGGGFGGKEDLTVQGHAALMASILQQPVQVALSREESLTLHPKRHPMTLQVKLGCTREGRLVALQAHFVGDSGAYASVGAKVLERAAGHATGAYDIPHVDVAALAVYTNNVPCGAMRGFGANQATFALECSIDDLCQKGGFDRWQFRYDNALTEGRTTATGQVLKGGVGVRRTLEAVRDIFHQARYAGIACGLKNTGIGNGVADVGRCRIAIRAADHVDILHGWTDMGQGCDTIAVQSLCESTGIDPAIVHVCVDTRDDAVCGMTTASRATSLLGNAVLDACKQLKRDLESSSLSALAGREYFGEWVCDWTTEPGHENGREICTHYSYSYATQVVVLDDEGKIETVYAAHDAGRIINPTLFEGQIEGSVHMGLGYALSEELLVKDGRPSTRLRDCGILRARQMPEVRVIGIEVADPHGPFGAKGVGEIGLVPTAPAVVGALRALDGRRRFTLPLREDCLRDRGTKAGRRAGTGGKDGAADAGPAGDAGV